MMRYLWAVALCAAVAAPSLAAPIVTFPDNVVSWNVGSGQSNGQFTVARDGTLEVGLRTQERFFGPNFTPVNAGGFANAMYNVPTGASPPPNSGGDLARWNLDYSVSSTGGAVTSAVLTVESLTPGLTPITSPVSIPVNLFPNPNLIQDSTNFGFGGFSGPMFDVNAAGIYRVSLTATNASGQTTSNSILVNIGNTPLSAIPEPATLAVFGALGCVALGSRKRRRASAV